MPDLPPLLRVRFTPGDSVLENEINRFNTFLARLDGESNQTYAQRLNAAGFCRLIGSEQLKDIGGYRQLQNEAQVQGVPILVMASEAKREQPRYKGVQTVDDIIDRQTGKVKESYLHSPGDAGKDRDAVHTGPTAEQTRLGDPGHAAGGNSGNSR